MPTSTLAHSIPVEATTQEPVEQKQGANGVNDKVRAYVIAWRDQLKNQRLERQNIWNECWALYNGQEDQSNKEDWQSKIVLPKGWSSVKQATSVLKRLLQVNKTPWQLEPYNQDDAFEVLKAGKVMKLGKVFLEKAHFLEEFMVGAETGFIIGLGVWKMGWSLLPRMRMRVQQMMVAAPAGTLPAVQGSLLAQPPPGPLALGQQPGQVEQQTAAQYPTQLPGEALPPQGAFAAPAAQPGPVMIPQKQIVREQILEGNLMVNAVDPYHFFWLPGSKLNRWTGTIEEITIPKWELMAMAKLGAFGPDGVETIKGLGAMKLDEVQEQSFIRFQELPRTNAAVGDMVEIKLTEFHGPVLADGELIEEYGHVIIANDTTTLLNGQNDKWFRTPPYIGFSPLAAPFRTDGKGLIEMVRSIDKALNQIVNLGNDTLLFRLLPVFEVSASYYENAEDIRSGMTPGKILRRSDTAVQGDTGIMPVQFNDVSPGAMQVAGVLDRAHQEGALISELQQSLPRWSGAQTATETEAIQSNQNSFFGAMASDMELNVLSPMIEMALDLIMQFLDTANDPRVASILGIDQQILAGMSQAEIYEMVQGDYKVHVRGLTDALEKSEMLQNLVQFMNLIGQNPQAWLPWIKQDQLLRRILEAFRPHIHDIEKILNDPQTAAAQEAAQAQTAQQSQILGILPELLRIKSNTDQHQQQTAVDQQNSQRDHEARVADQAIALKQANATAAKKEAA